MKLNKRGISPAISWVLLIGLSVTLAGMVTFWTRSISETTTEKLVMDVEHDMRCSEISLNAQISAGSNCGSSLSLDITNSGYFTIKKIKLRTTNTEEFEIEIKPTKTQTLNTNTNYPTISEVGIIPVTEVEGQLLGCLEREIKVNC
tara:strand:+ start:766 stop:1203 length:438 start_codon:yes stop_codon:yes gene_type:complete